MLDSKAFLFKALIRAIFLAFAAASLAAQSSQPAQPVTTYYHGTIGHTLEIQMTLTVSGNDITGAYEYANKRKPISLQGHVLPSQGYDISELGASGQPSAKFLINGLIGGLTGTWQSGKKKLPVTMGEISPPQVEQLHTMWSGNHKIKDVVAGDSFACALTESGAFCWGMVSGSPSLATAGPGTVAEKALPHLAIPVHISALAFGPATSCYLQKGGMYCWQPNVAYLRLPSPTLIPGFEKNVTEIGISGEWACAVVSGALKCWSGRSLDAKADLEVIRGGVTHLSSGTSNCVQASGKAVCWSANQDPAKAADVQIHEVAGMEDKLQMISSFNGFGFSSKVACVVEGGSLKCWGDDTGNVLLGRRGPSQFSYDLPPAVIPSMETGVSAVAVAAMNVCAIRDGDVLCWGDNLYGQVGNGNTSSTTGVQAVELPAPAVKVAMGSGYACALTSDNHVWCWGDNKFGQTGNRSRNTCQLPNGQIPGTIPNPCNMRPVQVRGIP